MTVMVAMAGMFLAGNAVFKSFAVGTILVVAVAIVGSLTVLPAMLSFLGRKGWTEKGRVPYISGLRHRTKGESRVWGAILLRVLARPVVSIVVAGGLLVALAIPALACTRSTPAWPGCRGRCRSCRPTTAWRRRSQAARSRRPWPSRPMTCARPPSRPASTR